MHKADNKNLFRQLQEEMGATNSALSSLLGVSIGTIEKRRAGKVKISDEVILAMLHVKSEKL